MMLGLHRDRIGERRATHRTKARPPGNTFKVGRFVLQFVEQPMKSLGASEREHLLGPLVELTRGAFQNPNLSVADTMVHAFHVDLAVFVFLDGRLVGFSSCAMLHVLDMRTCYLVGSAFAQEARSTGLYSLMIGARIAYATMRMGGAESRFATRTQNPIVVRRMAELGAFSDDQGDDRDSVRSLVALAQCVHRFTQGDPDHAHDACHTRTDAPGFEPEHRVIRGAYAGELSPVMPTSGDPGIDAYCLEHLDIAAGDAFLLTVRRNHRLTGEFVTNALNRLDASPKQLEMLMAALSL